MKKILIVLGIFCLAYSLNDVFAISEDFKFVIDTIGIPRYNTYKEEINEEGYYTYNIFSYGQPKNITKEQRWKNSKYGMWTKNGGSYKNKGTRGEYYVLGTSYSGALIYNYYFPMDVIPSTTPDKWTFYTYPGASDSWKDKTKYKYTEQLDHMKNSKLMFNDISSRDKADNPKYIKEYNITALQIGLSKARLDTAATWKTNGMISTRRKINGIIYSQVYLVKPMSANAKVNSTLDVADNYILKEDEEELVIPIKYSTNVINMTGYAKKEHIKEIKSSLYIDGKNIDEISGSKITSVGNEYMLVITRDNYPPNNNYNINITVDGYMYTEFSVDGLMRSKVSKNISVKVEPKRIIPVKNKELKILDKNKNKWVVRPLAQNYYTSNTQGFTEAGKSLAVKLDLNVAKENIKFIEILLDDKKIDKYNILESKEDLVLSLKIPEEIETTLYGIKSLRQLEGSYFDTSSLDICKRKQEPHILKIKFKYLDKDYVEEFEFDTLDNVLSNVNSTIKTSVNYSMEDETTLEDWIN